MSSITVPMAVASAVESITARLADTTLIDQAANGTSCSIELSWTIDANRSLVLMDGKRPVPANALMVSDVNAIPSALLERVEIISGGASAVYGADAVGGVVNVMAPVMW